MVIVAAPHGALVANEEGCQFFNQNLAPGVFGLVGVAAEKSHGEIHSRTLAATGGIAVDGIKHIGTAIVAQAHDGGEPEVVVFGVGFARNGHLVAFFPKQFAQSEALIHIRIRLPKAHGVALHIGCYHHIAVVAGVATMAGVDIHVGLFVGTHKILGQRCHKQQHKRNNGKLFHSCLLLMGYSLMLMVIW